VFIHIYTLPQSGHSVAVAPVPTSDSAQSLSAFPFLRFKICTRSVHRRHRTTSTSSLDSTGVHNSPKSASKISLDALSPEDQPRILRPEAGVEGSRPDQARLPRYPGYFVRGARTKCLGLDSSPWLTVALSFQVGLPKLSRGGGFLRAYRLADCCLNGGATMYCMVRLVRCLMAGLWLAIQDNATLFLYFVL